MIKNIITNTSKDILINVVPYKELSKRKRAEYLKNYKKNRKLLTKELVITLNKNDYEIFKTYAKLHGNTVNKEIVNLALSNINNIYLIPDSINKDLQQLIFLFRNIANNINQIAKNSNIFKTLLSSNKLLTKLKELESAVINFINTPSTSNNKEG